MVSFPGWRMIEEIQLSSAASAVKFASTRYFAANASVAMPRMPLNISQPQCSPLRMLRIAATRPNTPSAKANAPKTAHVSLFADGDAKHLYEQYGFAQSDKSVGKFYKL